MRVILLLNSLKKSINMIISLFPDKLADHIETQIRLNKDTKVNLSKSDLQSNMSVFGTDFKLQLLNNRNQIKEYLNRENKIYEETMMYCLKTILESEIIEKDKIVFFDLGAYAGYYSTYVSKKLDDKAIVCAIESNQKYYESILDTIRLNNLHKLKAFNAVLSDVEEELIVHKEMAVEKKHLIENMRTENTTYFEVREANEILNTGKHLKSVTLDNLCHTNDIYPNLVKIDVHGAEGKILMGSKKILNSSTKIILLELHQQHELNRYSDGITKDSIISLLHESEFNTYLIAPFRYNEKNVEYKFYKKNKKLLFVELTKENYQEVLFDRNNVDIFILCAKKGLNITNLECF